MAARVTKLVLQVERRRHSTANRGQMVRDSTMVTVGSLLETTIALSDGIVADPMCPSLSKKMCQNAPQNQLRDACCHLANMIEDIYKIALCCDGYHYQPSKTTLALVNKRTIKKRKQ